MSATTIHDWEKKSFVPTSIKGRLFTRLECRKCGAKARKFGNDIEIDVTSLRNPLMRNCVAYNKETK